jgi:hypothetical protein
VISANLLTSITARPGKGRRGGVFTSRPAYTEKIVLEDLIVEHQNSPIIEHLSWGVMEVAGLGSGKDVKLWPGGGRAWDWTETNTRHVPGIQIADIAQLIDQGANVVVLTRGMDLVLQTCAETIAWLNDHDVLYHILETRQAAKMYNELAMQGFPVGGVFHSTC